MHVCVCVCVCVCDKDKLFKKLHTCHQQESFSCRHQALNFTDFITSILGYLNTGLCNFILERENQHDECTTNTRLIADTVTHDEIIGANL